MSNSYSQALRDFRAEYEAQAALVQPVNDDDEMHEYKIIDRMRKDKIERRLPRDV